MLTELEHHSNLVPWQLLTQEKDADLEFVAIDDDGRLNHRLVRGAAAHAAQAGRLHAGLERPGHDQPGARDDRDGPRRRRAGAGRWRAGRAARAGRRPGARRRLLSSSPATRRSGPPGSGALWARRELLEAMPPFLAGGEMILEVHLRRTEFNDVPYKFEAGTPDIAAAIGLGAALEYLKDTRHGDGPRARARPDRVRARGPAARRAGHPHLRATLDLASAPASSHSTCQASIRTTWRRCSTARRSPCAPATTARCRSTSGSARRPRCGQASTSTTTATTSTGWPTA